MNEKKYSEVDVSQARKTYSSYLAAAKVTAEVLNLQTSTNEACFVAIGEQVYSDNCVYKIEAVFTDTSRMIEKVRLSGQII